MKPASMRPPKAGRPKGATRRATWKRSKRPEYCVCLVGFSSIVPRRLGDNRGGFPVAVVATKKPLEAHRNYDRGQPYTRVIVLEYTRVETEEHARRLKAALDMALVGNAARQNNDKARGLWRDVLGCFAPDDDESRHMWWIALLVAAEVEVRKTIRNFRSFDARADTGLDDLLRELG